VPDSPSMSSTLSPVKRMPFSCDSIHTRSGASNKLTASTGCRGTRQHAAQSSTAVFVFNAYPLVDLAPGARDPTGSPAAIPREQRCLLLQMEPRLINMALHSYYLGFGTSLVSPDSRTSPGCSACRSSFIIASPPTHLEGESGKIGRRNGGQTAHPTHLRCRIRSAQPEWWADSPPYATAMPHTLRTAGMVGRQPTLRNCDAAYAPHSRNGGQTAHPTHRTAGGVNVQPALPLPGTHPSRTAPYGGGRLRGCQSFLCELSTRTGTPQRWVGWGLWDE